MHIKTLPLFFGCACAALPSPPTPARLALRETPGAAVTVVQVKSPWYAPRGFIVRKFRDAVPEFQALDGLERKQFSFAQNGDYGGIYTWSRRADAEAWFGPQWHERVRRQRGVDGAVRFIAVTEGLVAPPERGAFEGPMVVTIAPDTLERYRESAGLLAAYAGEGLVISTWRDRQAAEAMLANKPGVEWFDTPIGLQNKR